MTGSSTIEVLDRIVADQIAAGEVIERPASIVKELVENSLDAGARDIHVSVVGGGRDLISVRDDGRGMSPSDAERAWLRHATSKLRRIEDLGEISSLGFRGEALASIAAVARVRLVTRLRDEPAATQVVLEQGTIKESGPTGAPAGTLIEVHDVFATLPARRKFLRSAQTEIGHIVEWLDRVALAHPEVGFICSHGGREVRRHPAVQRPEERLRQVLGAERARSMVAVAYEENGVQVRGWISAAGTSLPQARSVLTYVGRRQVRDRVLMRAVLDGYRALLPQGRYPATVLFVDVPPNEVDVNVHPTKTEVRFASPDTVYGAMLRGVRAALAARPASFAAAAAASVSTEEAPQDGTIGRVSEALSRYAASERASARAPQRSWRVALAPRVDESEARAVETQRLAPESEIAPAKTEPSTAPAWRFSDLRILGQAMNGYIVCEASDGLVLVDQHAAHERIRFERLRAAAKGPVASQRLLVPQVVSLGELTSATLLERASELAHGGFEIESFGPGELVVRAIPAALDVSTNAETLLGELASDLADLGASDRLDGARDTLLARVACHGAVRVGDPLVPAEMTRLLTDLDTIPFAATCPHGRPLLIELKRAEIERRVGRT